MAFVGVAYAASKAPGSDTSPGDAKQMSTRDTSQVLRISQLSEDEPLAVIAERRAALLESTSKLAAGAEVYPPSGTWIGTYSEDGKTGSTRYELEFDPNMETFRGTGTDADGLFEVELGCFESTSGQFIWGERTTRGGRTALFTICEGLVSTKNSFVCLIEGSYKSSTGRTGMISLRPATDNK